MKLQVEYVSNLTKKGTVEVHAVPADQGQQGGVKLEVRVLTSSGARLTSVRWRPWCLVVEMALL